MLPEDPPPVNKGPLIGKTHVEPEPKPESLPTELDKSKPLTSDDTPESLAG